MSGIRRQRYVTWVIIGGSQLPEYLEDFDLRLIHWEPGQYSSNWNRDGWALMDCLEKEEVFQRRQNEYYETQRRYAEQRRAREDAA